MARLARELFRCIDPFVVFVNGVPNLYGLDREVFSDDPILRSHPRNFVPSADRVEAMTAVPGERRTVSIPPRAVPNPELKELEHG